MVEITESITTAKRYHFIFSHAPQAAALEVCLSDKKNSETKSWAYLRAESMSAFKTSSATS